MGRILLYQSAKYNIGISCLVLYWIQTNEPDFDLFSSAKVSRMHLEFTIFLTSTNKLVFSAEVLKIWALMTEEMI